MSRPVLLIDDDIDQLASLSAALNSRGLFVVLADSVAVALERIKRSGADAIVARAEVWAGSDLVTQIQAEAGLRSVPRFALRHPGSPEPDGVLLVEAEELDGLVRQVFALPRAESTRGTATGDFRGDLQQVSLPDLLQLLGMNQRTGTLQLSTAQGAGELRLQDGDVVDAVHRSFEGRKALFRLLGESEGTFTFVSTTGTVLRRIEEPTRTLLFEGLRQVDETRRLMRSFAAGRDSFCAVVDATVATNQLEASVLERLATPTSVSELLDSLPDEDLAVLETLAALLERHALARVARPETRVSLASEDEMTVLGALVRRRRRLGFDGQLRIFLASDSARLARVRRSLSGIDGAVVSPQGSGTSFLRPLALLRVGDGAEMELVGVEDVPGLVPLLGLVLGGCQALVTLDCEASPALVSACELYGVALHAGEELLGEIDPEDPAQLAAMIRALLTVEAATGD